MRSSKAAMRSCKRARGVGWWFAALGTFTLLASHYSGRTSFRGDPKGNAGRTAFSLGSLLRLELDLEVYQQGFATMRAFIRLYVSRSFWIIMVVGGIHATARCARAQHEIF